MSFELLDDILLESGNETDQKVEDTKDEKDQTNVEEGVDNTEGAVNVEGAEPVEPVEPTVNQEDLDENVVDVEPIDEDLMEAISNTMYSDLDQLIENSMRTSLRTVITESSIPPETKIDQLAIVERVVFTQDQMSKFVNENIHPILDCAGVFSGTYNLGGDNPISVSLPLYETILTLHIANEGLLKSLKEEEEPKTIKNSLYESMIESQKQDEVDAEKSMEIVNEHLATLYERYNIEDDSDREALLDKALNIMNEHGVENIRPSLYELAECICAYNKKAEENEEKLFGETLPKDEDLSESDNIFVKALNRIRAKINGLVLETNTSDVAISLANTATGISAMVSWREERAKCNECVEKAFQEAVNSIKAQANSCENTKNVKMCESCNKKLEEKWTVQSEGVKRRVAGAVMGAGIGAVIGKLAPKFQKEYKDMKEELAGLKSRKKDATDDAEVGKLQKRIEELEAKMENWKKKMVRAGAAGGAVGGAIGIGKGK